MNHTPIDIDYSARREYAPINRAYASTFTPGRLSVGLVVPIENYDRSPVPQMQRHVERAQLAEELGFRALWLRDVIFNVPSFGDAGQTFDPFVYLGYLAAATERIALGVASIILPLRHPAHVARAAASARVSVRATTCPLATCMPSSTRMSANVPPASNARSVCCAASSCPTKLRVTV